MAKRKKNSGADGITLGIVIGIVIGLILYAIFEDELFLVVGLCGGIILGGVFGAGARKQTVVREAPKKRTKTTKKVAKKKK